MIPPLSEADLQQRIIDYARLRAWHVMHTRPAKTDKGWRTPITGDVGFPDLVLARRGVVWFFEVKSTKGRATADQDGWLYALGGPEHARVVRPSDWDWIQEVLK
jgi:hypothetical protein